MDLNNSVILPREDYIELTTAAYDNPTRTERIESTVQSTALFGAIAAATALGTWGWAKAVDWKDRRKFDRELKMAEHQAKMDSASKEK